MERAPKKEDGPGSTLDALRALLDAGAALAVQIGRPVDPLRNRLDRIFERVLPDDRAGFLDLLEREVDIRHMAHGEPTVSGLGIGPVDPNARLFVRVWDRRPTPGIADDLLQAMLRGVRHMLEVPASLGVDWPALCTEVLRRLTPTERAGFLSAMRGWIAAGERLEGESAAKAS